MGIVNSTSETTFTQSAEAVYDGGMEGPVAKLTPAPAVRDTFPVFCKGMIG
ncbi:hypothetical protein [Mycobacterium parmense]|uniref:Uncharacterized protein n=1 Tax=Mycobacterium parmense TaxID=185642 RepID=A0A7I7YYE8_9MYCO|nr:hypothetical protein [Mycobacterium parmense]MCV7350094.1 hypothetical protein [Mycobacterium parmense]BBZ46372.1 hypothetical protein MPRM_36530 [Mycobacterium parmense]